MRAERSTSPGMTATLSRSSARGIPRIEARSFTSVSTSRPVNERARPRINIGGLSPFIPDMTTVVSDRQGQNFNPKNLREFHINLPVRSVVGESAVVDLKKDRLTTERKSRESNPRRSRRMLREYEPKIDAARNTSSPVFEKKSEIVIPGADEVTGSKPEKYMNNYVFSPQVARVNDPVRALEQKIAYKYIDLGLASDMVEAQTRVQKIGTAQTQKIIGVGFGEVVRSVPPPKSKKDEEEEREVRKQKTELLFKNPANIKLRTLRLEEMLAVLKKTENMTTANTLEIVAQQPRRSSVPKAKDVLVVFDSIGAQKNKTPTKVQEKTAKQKPVRDMKADGARLESINTARAAVIQESKSTGKAPRWYDVARALPQKPTESMTSDIVKGRVVLSGGVTDGSYTEVLADLKSMGVIFPKQNPDAILSSKPAVQIGESGEVVSRQDVFRVIGTDDLDLAA